MALTRFLQKRTLPLPLAVTTPPAKDAAGDGFVTVDFPRGALFLRDAADKYHRLSWGEVEEDAAGADARRALPPGAYVVTGYRIVKVDEAGKAWHVSVSARAVREIEVKAGKSTAVKIDPTIHIDSKVAHAGVQVAIRGDEKAGLSIYQGDSRIPLGYRLVGADGREIAAGEMKYG